MKLLLFDTEGTPPGNFEKRIRNLVGDLPYDYFYFDRTKKFSSEIKLLKQIRKKRPALLVMEGTGFAGGASCLIARIFFRVKFVFSSGDAVGPYLSSRHPWLAPLFYLYEWLLFRFCAGFIGWTPYYCGRAFTMGADRAVTAANWAEFSLSEEDRLDKRKKVREKLGISEDKIIIGMIGALRWNRRYRYCYGKEVVEAVKKCRNPQVVGVVVGDGSGRPHLKELASDSTDGQIILPGAVPREEVPDYLAAMDIVTLPQSVDGVGGMRYTTKLSEYMAARVPVAVSRIPLAYDFSDDYLWTIAGKYPWQDRFTQSLCDLLDKVTMSEIDMKRKSVPSDHLVFNKEDQVKRVRRFLADLLEENS